MSSSKWNDKDIIITLANEFSRFCELYRDALAATESGSGYQMINSELDGVMEEVYKKYRRLLTRLIDSSGKAVNGMAIYAVKNMFFSIHDHHWGINYHEAAEAEAIDPFQKRMFEISDRGSFAHNFCMPFLQVVGKRHYGIQISNEPIENVDALIETAVRTFEGNREFAFETMLTRVFSAHRPKVV